MKPWAISFTIDVDPAESNNSFTRQKAKLQPSV
jgi:hypothetical protein